jgi:DNA-binding transcriptional LysR family regulator
MTKMELSDLHVFRTVAEEGGIGRAARRLHRVPSNVSTRVKQLEASVGAQLFVRDRQRLYLSPSGELLLDYASRLLTLADEAKGVVGGGTPRGPLRVGALESTTASRLPSLFVDFHRRWPEVRVELTTGTNDALLTALAERRVDAAFVAEAPAAPGFSHLPLFDERLALITPLGHRPVKRPSDVDGETVIAFPSGCAYRRVIERWLGPGGLTAVRVLELASYHAIVACVAAGVGIAVMPESVLDTVHGTHVLRHALPPTLARRTTPFVWRAQSEAQEGAALRRLRELVQETRDSQRSRR